MSSNECVFVGDADYFSDDHVRVASNGVHRALAKDESVYFMMILNLLPDAVIDESSRRTIDGHECVSFTSAPAHGEQLCTMYLEHPSPEANWQLNDFAPKFEGIVGEASVLGTCAWPNGFGGEVALSMDNTIFTAVVPDFYLKTGLLTPGARRLFRFSASAEALTLQTKKSISVSEGSFYEGELAQFLKDHPDKTQADFPEVSIS